MGLSPEGFYSLTPRQFANKLTGFRRVQDAAMREGWEQTRQIMWAMLTPYQKKGQTLKPEGILQLPWEKKAPEAQLLDAEETAKLLERQKEFWKKVDEKKSRQSQLPVSKP